jgi:hypothetical protein
MPAACTAAFATLHRISGGAYRKAVTVLTLFGGFASTVFWPLSQFLLDTAGWRAAFGVFAALNLLICLPVHLLMLPRGHAAPAPGHSTHPLAPPPVHAPAIFAWLATALAGGVSIGAFGLSLPATPASLRAMRCSRSPRSWADAGRGTRRRVHVGPPRTIADRRHAGVCIAALAARC